MTGEPGMTGTPEPEGTAGPSGPLERVDAGMAALRSDDRRRRGAFVGAVAAGLAAAWVHWAGLVVAGALIGVTRRRLLGALAAGLAFGVFAVGVTVVAAPAVTASGFVALAPLNYVTVALGLILPSWGSLARYVV